METNDMSGIPEESWKPKFVNLVRAARNHVAWPLSLVGFLVIGAIGVFADLAEDVHNAERITVTDQHLADWLHAHATPTTTQIMLAVSAFHDVVSMSILTLLLALLLIRWGKRDWLLGLVLVVPGGIVINTLFKYLFARARPHFTDPIVTLSSYSFPSGHVTGATLFYGFLAAFLVSRTHSRTARATIVAVAPWMVVLVAASRLYLGAHFLSDVLAAFFESVAWLGLCLVGLHAIGRQRAATTRSPRTGGH